MLLPYQKEAAHTSWFIHCKARLLDKYDLLFSWLLLSSHFAGFFHLHLAPSLVHTYLACLSYLLCPSCFIFLQWKDQSLNLHRETFTCFLSAREEHHAIVPPLPTASLVNILKNCWQNFQASSLFSQLSPQERKKFSAWFHRLGEISVYVCQDATRQKIHNALAQ